MGSDNMRKILMIVVLLFALTGCDLSDFDDDTRMTDDSTGTGDISIELIPDGGTDEESYHIEINFLGEGTGDVEDLYWQISDTVEYDDSKWIEAVTCWFLCDYVLDIEDVSDGVYYLHTKVVTSETTKYLVSDDTYTINNPSMEISISVELETVYETFGESYTVVGDALIFSGKDYVTNTKYSLDGNRLVVVSPTFQAVLEEVE